MPFILPCILISIGIITSGVIFNKKQLDEEKSKIDIFLDRLEMEIDQDCEEYLTNKYF